MKWRRSYTAGTLARKFGGLARGTSPLADAATAVCTCRVVSEIFTAPVFRFLSSWLLVVWLFGCKTLEIMVVGLVVFW
jgi:hypothetical protein